MRAVNLLPASARPARPGSVREASVATIGLFAALALALVFVAAYVFLSNDVSSRRNQLAAVSERADAVQRQAVKLKPYAQLAALSDQTLGRLRTLAAGRYDWSLTLTRLARALPSDVTLSSLDGELSGASSSSTPTAASAATPGASSSSSTTPSASSSSSTPTTASSTTTATPAAGATGPSVQLQGCTLSHTAVARAMDRLRRVEGVVDVQLTSSSFQTQASGASGTPATGASGAGAGAGSGGCPREDQFQLTVALGAASATGAPTTATSTAPTAASPTPAPTAAATSTPTTARAGS